jgi:hypothetical protein
MDNTGGTGNVDVKRSAFKIRTKPASQQGMRTSALMTEGGNPSLKPIVKAGEKLREARLSQSNFGLPKEQGEAKVLKPVETKEEMNEDNVNELIDKTEGYVVKNFKAKQAGLKNQSGAKMSRVYKYDDLEIFATRFSPDDSLLAVGKLWRTQASRMER